MTPGEQAQQAQQPKERLIYSSVPWKIYEQDAGMGEHDYAVFLNDVFYCRTDDSQTAQRIVESIRSRPSPAPAQENTLFSETTLERVRRQAREDEREKVLEELRTLCMKDESVGVTVFHHIQSLRQAQPQER